MWIIARHRSGDVAVLWNPRSVVGRTGIEYTQSMHVFWVDGIGSNSTTEASIVGNRFSVVSWTTEVV